MNTQNIQLIEKNGKPEYAVVPYAAYLKLLEMATEEQDIRDYKEAKAITTEYIPSEYVNRFLEGENTILVWREYRNLTQAQLAKKAKISIPYLSQLETGKRTGKLPVLKKLATALEIELEDLII